LGALLRYSAQGNERELPIGTSAGRILAEASLIAVDEELAKGGLDFWRYVNDYRILVDDPRQAHAALMAAADRLAARGLYLSRQRTRITPINAETAARARAELAKIGPASFVVDSTIPRGMKLVFVGYGGAPASPHLVPAKSALIVRCCPGCAPRYSTGRLM
jgi:hypothetical protein